jgi:hypothetical protein
VVLHCCKEKMAIATAVAASRLRPCCERASSLRQRLLRRPAGLTEDQWGVLWTAARRWCRARMPGWDGITLAFFSGGWALRRISSPSMSVSRLLLMVELRGRLEFSWQSNSRDQTFCAHGRDGVGNFSSGALG